MESHACEKTLRDEPGEVDGRVDAHRGVGRAGVVAAELGWFERAELAS